MTWNRFLILIVIVMSGIIALAQDDTTETSCTVEDLQVAIENATAEILEANPTAIEDNSPTYLYAVGDVYTQFALDCGYQPTFPEVEAQVDRTLDLVPLAFIINASSIGSNVDVALEELENIDGDSFNGQLLYNGLEVGLDGAELGCAGCHNGEVAPLTEGTYTRIIEERLTLDEFSEYTFEQYVIESILHPMGYIVPEYANVQMPTNYGGRLDAQMLADLVAYLESQDQLLESIETDEVDDTEAETVACVELSADECETFSSLEGNALRGENLYNGSAATEFDLVLGCAGCHSGGVIGPALNDLSYIEEDVLTLPQFEDYTLTNYLVEAIYNPNAYVGELYAEGIMPGNYRDQIGLQDLADLVAYLQDSE